MEQNATATVSPASLETLLAYRFKDSSLLELALTHPSVHRRRNHASGASPTPGHNQRLEFLGDSVLGLIVAEMLYTRFPGEKEGALAKRHAALVCGATLAEVAGQMGLGAYLYLGNAEDQAGGRENLANLEDACEALIGALYLDGGLEAAQQFVERYWTPLTEAQTAPPKDAKSQLQEWTQARSLGLPVYEVVESSGPAHAPQFTIEVTIEGFSPVRAQAGSKQVASQAAAEKMLHAIVNNAPGDSIAHTPPVDA